MGLPLIKVSLKTAPPSCLSVGCCAVVGSCQLLRRVTTALKESGACATRGWWATQTRCASPQQQRASAAPLLIDQCRNLTCDPSIHPPKLPAPATDPSPKHQSSSRREPRTANDFTTGRASSWRRAPDDFPAFFPCLSADLPSTAFGRAPFVCSLVQPSPCPSPRPAPP